MRYLFCLLGTLINFAPAYADWVRVGTISDSAPGYLCDMDDTGRDLYCAGNNPQVLANGGISATSISTSVINFAGITATSVLGAGGNFIVSGTTSVSASNAGTIKFATAGSERMVIDGSGRVGVNTASPQTTLEVDGTISATAMVVNGELVNNSSGVPAGAVMAFAMSTPPDGWLKADGSPVSRSTYSDLFAAIGTTFGAGDGATTFNLPDMRGEFVRGWDDGRGVDSGRSFGSSQKATLVLGAAKRSIGGWGNSFYDADISAAEDSDLPAETRSGTSAYFQPGIAGSLNWVRQGNRVRSRNVALMHCIKY